MSVRVSVIVPVYNAEKYLKECFDSLTGVVNYNEIEIIAVDDGSVDGSAEICDAYAAKYDNFKVIHQKNSGVSAARNAGMDAAQGEFIGFSDADDYVYPEIYKAMLESADQYGSDIIMCRFTKELKVGTEECGANPGDGNYYRGDKIITEIVHRAMVSHQFNNVYNKLFSRETINENNVRFPEGKKYGEDRDFVLSYLSHARCVSFSDYVGYFYRYVESGAINRSRNNYVEILMAQYEADIRAFSAFDIDPSFVEQECGVALIKNYNSTFWIIDEKYRGREKRRLFRAVMENAEIRELFEKWYDKTFEAEFSYDRNIMKAVRNRNVCMIDMSIQLQKLSAGVKRIVRKVIKRSVK